MRSACSRNRLLLEGSMNSTPVKGRFGSAFWISVSKRWFCLRKISMNAAWMTFIHRQNTNIENIYVRASVDIFCHFHNLKLQFLFNILLVLQILCRYKWHSGRLTCTDKTQKKHYGGQVPPPFFVVAYTSASMCEPAERASLEIFRIFTIKKCHFFQYFVGTSDMLVGLHVPTKLRIPNPPPPGYARASIQGGPERMQRIWSLISRTSSIKWNLFLFHYMENSFSNKMTPW